MDAVVEENEQKVWFLAQCSGCCDHQLPQQRGLRLPPRGFRTLLHPLRSHSPHGPWSSQGPMATIALPRGS